MAFTYLGSAQSAGGLNGSTTGNVNTTGAKIILISSGWSSANTVTVSDSNGNTYTQIGYKLGAGTSVYEAIYYCIRPVTSVNHNFTISVTGGYPAINVAYFNSKTTPILDSVNTSDTYTGFTSTNCSLLPANNGSLLFSSCSTIYGLNPISVNAGFTIGSSHQFEVPLQYMNASAYLIQNIAASVTPQFTWANDTFDEAQSIAAFYEGPIQNSKNYFTEGQLLKSGWGFKNRMRKEHLRKSTTLGNSLDAPIIHFWLGWQYNLYRWDGSYWVKAKMREYSGTDWLVKPLKVWDGTVWVEVDNFG